MKINNTRAQSERKFFDLLASQGTEYWGWKTKTGQYRLKIRAELITHKLKIKPGHRVLEIGCHMGGMTKYLIESQAKITAVDISPRSIKVAKSQVKSPNLAFKVEDIHNLRFGDGYFDMVVGNGILHHIDLEPGLPEILRVLKPKGQVLFLEPNLANPEIMLERYVPFFRKLSKSSPDEVAYTRWQLAKILSGAGFKNVKVLPFDFMYPALPFWFIKRATSFFKLIEQTPVVQEIAGSLIVQARKAS